MNERPIICSGPMVRAILDGRKAQTRRVVNQLAGFGRITEFGLSDTPGYDFHFRDRDMRWNDVSKDRVLSACPFGQPGDCLYVRETWFSPPAPHNGLWGWQADGDHPHGRAYRIRPSIHMPKKYARLWLEVTGVRVERVQDISEDDAKAEGVLPEKEDHIPLYSHRVAFERLWDRLNAKRAPWDSNPWVWVISFRQTRP